MREAEILTRDRWRLVNTQTPRPGGARGRELAELGGRASRRTRSLRSRGAVWRRRESCSHIGLEEDGTDDDRSESAEFSACRVPFQVFAGRVSTPSRLCHAGSTAAPATPERNRGTGQPSSLSRAHRPEVVEPGSASDPLTRGLTPGLAVSRGRLREEPPPLVEGTGKASWRSGLTLHIKGLKDFVVLDLMTLLPRVRSEDPDDRTRESCQEY